MTEAPLFLVAFLLLISVLIVIHEFGHYAVARLVGVKVLRFSLGFGKVLWSRRLGRDQTEWALCALPLGGYVKMVDEREVAPEAPIPEADLPRAFNRQSVGKRAAIVAAGPCANLLLALLLYVVMFTSGTEAMLPILGDPLPDTPAAAAGIQNGDRVLAVDATPVATWEALHWQTMRAASAAKHITLEVASPDGARRTLTLATAIFNETMKQSGDQDPIARLGLRTYRAHFPARIAEVAPGMPAQMAGIQKGYTVIAANGKPVQYRYQVQDAVLTTPEGGSLSLTLQRQAAPDANAAQAPDLLTVTLTPQSVRENGRTLMRIGLVWAEPSQELIAAQPKRWTTVRYGPLESVERAFSQVWETSTFSLRMFGRILTGQVSWRNLSGPVAIAEYAGRTAQIGLEAYLKFMALVSVSLAILNLLPVPVLDGGHLMYYAIEVVKRGPVSERMMNWGQNVGLTFLILLMAFALFNDLSRLLGHLFNG